MSYFSYKGNHVVVKGLSFVEFSGNKPHLLIDLFEKMGLYEAGNIPSKSASLYAQGNIRFISNPSNGGNAEQFRATHGRGASAIGFKVDDSETAFHQAIELGARPAETTDYDIPAICGVGKSLIYLVDKVKEDALFTSFGAEFKKDYLQQTHLMDIDHLTHNEWLLR